MDERKWSIKVTSKGQITLPKHVRDLMMVHEGDYLEGVLKDDALVLTRRMELDDQEQIRLLAHRRLIDLGYPDSAARTALDPRRIRETLPELPVSATALVRDGREER